MVHCYTGTCRYCATSTCTAVSVFATAVRYVGTYTAVLKIILRFGPTQYKTHDYRIFQDVILDMHGWRSDPGLDFHIDPSGTSAKGTHVCIKTGFRGRDCAAIGQSIPASGLRPKSCYLF